MSNEEQSFGEMMAELEPDDLVEDETADAGEADAADSPGTTPDDAPIEEPLLEEEGADEEGPGETPGDEEPAGEPGEEAQTDEEPAEEAETPEETAQAPPPTMVPVGALREEREKRQALQEENARLKAAAGGEKPPAGEPDEADPVADLDDNDFLTKADLTRIRAADRETNARAAAEVARTRQVRESETAALATYGKEAVGEGLDYETVLSVGFKNLSENDKALIRLAEDPCTEAYRRTVMRTPALSELWDKRREETFLAQRRAKTPPKKKAREAALPPAAETPDEEDDVTIDDVLATGSPDAVKRLLLQ